MYRWNKNLLEKSCLCSIEIPQVKVEFPDRVALRRGNGHSINVPCRVHLGRVLRDHQQILTVLTVRIKHGRRRNLCFSITGIPISGPERNDQWSWCIVVFIRIRVSAAEYNQHRFANDLLVFPWSSSSEREAECRYNVSLGCVCGGVGYCLGKLGVWGDSVVL